MQAVKTGDVAAVGMCIKQGFRVRQEGHALLLAALAQHDDAMVDLLLQHGYKNTGKGTSWGIPSDFYLKLARTGDLASLKMIFEKTGTLPQEPWFMLKTWPVQRPFALSCSSRHTEIHQSQHTHRWPDNPSCMAPAGVLISQSCLFPHSDGGQKEARLAMGFRLARLHARSRTTPIEHAHTHILQ